MLAQSRLFFCSTSCIVILLSAVVPAVADDPARETADRQFQRAYYLETHDENLEAAAEAYERVVGERKAAAPLLQEAKQRLAGIREEQAAADFARLMPPDTLVYAELSNPGRHVAQLARLLNLVADPHAAPAGKGVPLEEGFYLPDPLTISPALLNELEKFRGVAVAITELDVTGRRPPRGVLVAHPGHSDMIRGLLETSLQVIEPTEPIGGFATCTYMGQVWITRTERLVLVATSREAIEQTVDRLDSDATGRLSDEPSFVRSRHENEGALLYAWVNGPRMLRQFEGHMRGEEAMIARAVLDLEHMQSVSLAVTTTESGLAARARLDLADDHQNLVYGLIRTAPLTRKSLEYIPQGAAGLAVIGLNRPVDAPTPNLVW
jgi:exonuclease VII small subunit